MADTIVDLRMSRRGLIKLGGAAAVATTGAAGAGPQTQEERV